MLHGIFLGPFDELTRSGLTQQAGVTVHSYQQDDQIDELIPWTSLVWTQVHHGQLPLWNPYSALGLPLAFNWQSAPFSLSMLVAYLFPLRLAYTMQWFVTLLVAGTGAYVLGRVLKLGVMGAAFMATVYELSGPFIAWLGWPVESVMSWTGWLFAAVLLILRGGRRVRHIAFFAVCLMFALFAGEPDACGIVLGALCVFVVVVLVLRRAGFGGRQPVLRPLGDVVVATAAGGMLAAPIALPSAQLTVGSVRAANSAPGLGSSHVLVHLLLQGYNGLPISGDLWFGTSPTSSFYAASAAYLGLIALALATLALIRLWRRRDVIAMAVVVVVTMTITFAGPVVTFLDHTSHLKTVGWHLALVPMAFGMAVLSGFGMDLLVRSWRDRSVHFWATAGFVLWSLVLAGLWLFDRGRLSSADATIRNHSFVWPTVDAIVGLLVLGAIWVLLRNPQGISGRFARNAGIWVGAILLVAETAFLVSAGAPWPSSSRNYLQATPAVTSLKRAVGSSLVAIGKGLCVQNPFSVKGTVLGLNPDVNVAFDIDELAVYDPLTPEEYTTAWKTVTHHAPGVLSAFGAKVWYCPVVNSARLARLYGVGYILEPPSARAPAGTLFVEKVGNEDLYRVPAAAQATLSAAPLRGPFPPVEARGTPVEVSHPVPTEWKLTTHASRPTVLRLRLTDVPGWHASIDGKPLPLSKFAGVMLQAHIPAGTHTVKLNYWPTTFTVGIVLAVLVACGMVAGLSVEEVASRGRSRRSSI